MKILYYNYSFLERIGGGTHAREVLAALHDLPGVETHAYPDSCPAGAPVASKQSPMSILSLVPRRWRAWVYFWFKPLQRELNEISARIEDGCDVLLFRPNAFLRLLPDIKKRHPEIHLCAEINALVHAEGGMSDVLFRSFWVQRETALINAADSVVVVSNYLKAQLVRLGVSGDKILVNPNGVNLDRFGETAHEQREDARREFNIPGDAFVLGYVGGMESFRKLPLMVGQILELMKEDERIYFVMAGDGQDRAEIDRILAEVPEKIRERIRFGGAVPYGDVPKLMSTFDCALFPYSNPYGSPQKLFEYMAMGIPVIGPDVPVVREVFEDQKHLVLADQSGNDFVALVKQIIEEPEFAAVIAPQGKDLVLKEYTWQHNAERLVEFLQKRQSRKGIV